MLHLDLSPYTLAARRYRDNLASDTSWMQLTRLSVLFCAVLGYGTRLLLVFLSAVADVFRLVRGFSADNRTGARSASN